MHANKIRSSTVTPSEQSRQNSGIVKGKLSILPDLPPHLRQGIFAEPGKTYDATARYANEPVFLQPDQAPRPRGLSMKVWHTRRATQKWRQVSSYAGLFLQQRAND